RHLVPFPAFLVQPKPPAFSLLEVVLDVHAERGANASKAVDHDGNEGAIAHASESVRGDAVEQGPGLLSSQHRRLSPFHDVLGAADGGSRVAGHDLADDKEVEEHAEDGEVLLYGGPGVRSAEILDVGRNEEGAELVKGEPMGDAPLGELARGPGVRLPGVAVTDAGGEEFDELEPGLFAGVPEEN